MTQHSNKVAILFADICGSTALYENLGDDKARQLISQCLKDLQVSVDNYQGRLIKTIGDEILCTFPDARLAYQAACNMQLNIKDSRDGAEYPMYIRVGFHYGEVIEEDNDVFGDTVNVAARVASITRANQIMTTQAVFDTLPNEDRTQVCQVMRTDIKGKQEKMDIFLVTWDLDDLQSTRIGIPAFRKMQEPSHELSLNYRDKQIKVNKSCPSVTLGRSNNCHMMVQNNFASRQHVRVELRFGKFYIADQSTNGTFVRFNDGNVVYLARESLVLQGRGSISLGQAYSDGPTELVEFEVKSVG